MIVLIVLFIWWTSPRPVDAATQRVHVTSGELRSMTVSDDGLSGAIEIDAPRECAVIDWSARTTDGISLHTVRAWRDGCDKTYLPVFLL